MRAFIVRLTLLICSSFSLGASAFLSPADFNKESSEFKALVFLSSFCPCSQSHVNHLNEIEKAYPNLKIYGVITDEISENSQAGIDNYYSKDRFDFPIIEDQKQNLVKQFDALKTPHVVLLQKKNDGNYHKIYEGGVTDQRQFSRSQKKFLKENLVALSNNQPLPYANGRSLGCYIRRF